MLLSKALEEIGPVQMPADHQAALKLQGDLAPALADVLYRLCIEYGLPFAPFRETVIGIMADQAPAVVGTQKSAARIPFAAGLEEVHPLILLALEMMPAEGVEG